MLDSIFSTISVLTNGSEIDTTYLNESLERSDFDEVDWEQYERRRRTHAERLSSSSRSAEQHLADLFEDTVLLEE